MYEIIGKLTVYAFEIALVLIVMALFFGYIALKKRILFYGFFAKVLDFFYYPLLTIYSHFDKEKDLESLMVNLKNQANLERFKEGKKRIIFAPHCLRHVDCPAYATREGIQCKSCGKCIFTRLKQEASKRDIPLYIITGSSFVKRVVKLSKPETILGIGCAYELNKCMRALDHTGIATYGIALEKDGCYNTEVDFDKVVEAMDL